MTSLPGDTNISFDLDSLERDPKDVKAPFIVKVGDRLITMVDPEDFDWMDLAAITSPVDFLEFCFASDDDRDHFRNQADIKGWKLGQLMDAYMKHYGLDEKMKQAERQERMTARRG